MSRMGDVDGHEFSLGWFDIYIDGSFHAKVFGGCLFWISLLSMENVFTSTVSETVVF